MAFSFFMIVILTGLILLSHACYSAYEHSLLQNLSLTRAQEATPIHKPAQLKSLPPDISAETVLAVVLICVGLVSGADNLKPINWRIWAGQVEKLSGGGGPYQGLEERPGFVNIRAKRQDFADWVRRQNSNDKKIS